MSKEEIFIPIFTAMKDTKMLKVIPSQKISSKIQAEVISLKAQGYTKCPRCQKYNPPLNYDNLCDRCCLILVEHFPDDPCVPLIKEQNRKVMQQLNRNAFIKESAIMSEE